MTLNGKVALVTGASRGIGAAVAHRLADEGVKLGLASRSGTDLGLPDAVAQPCDVSDAAQLEAIVAATVDRFGGLDILVANAASGARMSARAASPRTSHSNRDEGEHGRRSPG